MFFLGLTVGLILGIALVSLLSAGARADEQMENIVKHSEFHQNKDLTANHQLWYSNGAKFLPEANRADFLKR